MNDKIIKAAIEQEELIATLNALAVGSPYSAAQLLRQAVDGAAHGAPMAVTWTMLREPVKKRSAWRRWLDLFNELPAALIESIDRWAANQERATMAIALGRTEAEVWELGVAAARKESA